MNDYWTQQEVEALEKVQTFDELADVALIILKRMHETGKEIVQLCGPMSTGGLNDMAKNFELFERAIEVATEKGCLVFNQIPFQHAMGRIHQQLHPGEEYCAPILEIFYRRIFESGYVSRTLFLKLWQTSTGATWEHNLVTTLPIKVEDYPEEWYEEAVSRMAA